MAMPTVPASPLGGLTWLAWALAAAALLALAATLTWFSYLFGYAYELADIPALPLAAGLVVAGLIFVMLPALVRHTLVHAPDSRRLVIFVVIVGIALRGMFIVSEPALEDDYQRYLWDGAVTAHGLNPYALSPLDAARADQSTVSRTLVTASGEIHSRINHPYLKTIYPPVAQAAFVLAHWIKPWSLVAWRAVCMAGELVTVALLLALLGSVGRSPLWVTLYWWNPVVIKELANAAHMEAILLPLVMAAMLFAVRQRFLSSTIAIGLAIGAKLWPVILVPLLWRALLRRPAMLIACAAVLAALTLVWVLPAYLGGIDSKSGFVAYARSWKTNSALFPQLEHLGAWLLPRLGLPDAWAGLGARAVLAGLLGVFTLALAWRPLAGGADLMQRSALVVAALFLLSPAQYPWYATWMFAFLPFLPRLSLALVAVFIPLYYTAFYFIAADRLGEFTGGVVWLIWVPIWTAIALDLAWTRTAWRRWRPGGPRQTASVFGS